MYVLFCLIETFANIRQERLRTSRNDNMRRVQIYFPLSEKLPFIKKQPGKWPEKA